MFLSRGNCKNTLSITPSSLQKTNNSSTILQMDSNVFFHKKVYTKIYAPHEKGLSIKKIIPSSKRSGLREEFKRIFLPLLIDIFELKRSMASPNEVLKRLTELQLEIEESRKWCEGVILQVAKGIEEAKEALQFIEKINDNSKNGS